MEQATDGAETAAIDGLVSSWSENISVSFCLRAPGYRLTLWCALGLLAGGAVQVPQLQLQHISCPYRPRSRDSTLIFGPLDICTVNHHPLVDLCLDSNEDQGTTEHLANLDQMGIRNMTLSPIDQRYRPYNSVCTNM